MPAMQTPRTHGHPTDAIAGEPAPTEPAPAVGAGLARDAGAADSLTPHRRHRRQASSNRARASCGSGSCPRCRRRELTDTPPTPSQASLLQQSPRQLWKRVLPAMQPPRTHGHPTDAIAGKPAPTDPAPAVGAGLARDAGAADSQAPHRRHRRQASSNRARAACRSRACPRCRRRGLAGTPPTPSQASLLQQTPA